MVVLMHQSRSAKKAASYCWPPLKNCTSRGNFSDARCYFQVEEISKLLVSKLVDDCVRLKTDCKLRKFESKMPELNF